jgi:hypothetical protein
MTTDCKFCGGRIEFNNSMVSRQGRKIPLNPDFTLHQCQQKAQVWREQNSRTCMYCRLEQIYFTEDHKSDSGKYLPVSLSTNQVHKCQSNPFNRRK